MKRIGLMAMALVILTMAMAPQATAQVKVGIIISERLLNEYPEAQDAQRVLSEEINEWQTQAQNMQEELQTLQQELQKIQKEKLPHQELLINLLGLSHRYVKDKIQKDSL